MDMLKVFEAKALAEALTDAGHSVSERTVQRWKAGKTKPKPQDVRAIRNLVGAQLALDAEKSRPQPSDWNRLMERVDAIVVAVDARVGETRAERLIRLAAEGIGTPPAPDAAAGSTGQGPQSQAPPSGPTPRPGQ